MFSNLHYKLFGNHQICGVIIFRLSDTPIPTLEIDYTGLTPDKPISRIDLNRLEQDFHQKINPNRQAIIDFLKQKRIISEFGKILTSQSIDKMNIEFLVDIREKLDDILGSQTCG